MRVMQDIVCRVTHGAAWQSIRRRVLPFAANGFLHAGGISSTGKQHGRKMSNDGQYLQVTACKVGDMKNGEMREVEFGRAGKALLLKDDGKFSAIGDRCTHHKAPLIKGVFYKGRVRCPWHGACFNAKSGDIEDYPGLDSLHCFEVVVQGEDVIVKALKSNLENFRRQKPMVEKKEDDGHGVVIVGSGGAALTCAESLRQNSFTEKITMLTRDENLPYDRTKLSKDLTLAVESIYLRDQHFFDKYGIEVRHATEVKSVDSSSKCVHTANGQAVPYDKLLLATGASPRTLPIPGFELDNVFVLRTPEDAATIVKKGKGKNAVIIGASFIGMEVASSLVDRAASVSVCEFFSTPYQTVLGPDVGKVLQSLHEERGIKFHMNAAVAELKGEGGMVKQAVLKSGVVLEADVVVAGVGVVPSTGFLKGSGIDLDSRGFVPVNKYLQTNVPDIYAAGDIAVFPLKMLNWQPVNVQHWQMAHFHGNAVGKNMVAEKSTEVDAVPFFWTNLAPGKNVRYTGYGAGHDDIVITGSLEDRKFCAYYCKGENVIAMSSFMMDPKASAVAEKWYNGEKILKSEVA